LSLVIIYLELIKIIFLFQIYEMKKTVSVSLLILGVAFSKAQQKVNDTIRKETTIEDQIQPRNFSAQINYKF